jgi:hypothetical protein
LYSCTYSDGSCTDSQNSKHSTSYVAYCPLYLLFSSQEYNSTQALLCYGLVSYANQLHFACATTYLFCNIDPSGLWTLCCVADHAQYVSLIITPLIFNTESVGFSVALLAHIPGTNLLTYDASSTLTARSADAMAVGTGFVQLFRGLGKSISSMVEVSFS